ncbi:MAG: glycosyltransferase family 4 protein [Nitrospiraceae bacterium]
MANDVNRVRLALFFTRGVSLRTWDGIGLLDREVALYRKLAARLRRITFVTYGDRQDRTYHGRWGGIGVQCNRWGMPAQTYQRFLTTVVPWSWRGPVVVKSNQIEGADIALRAARRGNKPFIARCGYLLSDNMERTYGAGSPQAERAHALERDVFAGADRVVVTTSAIMKKVIRQYRLKPDRVRVIPNHVDMVLFSPAPGEDRRLNRLCYVGRLEQEKNPRALIEAIQGMDVELIMVGSGSLEESLRHEVRDRRLRVTFMGNVPNSALPRLLNSAAAFVMPSFIEGHPKALLEAMACGLPVIGANVLGIRELISDGRTGVLCDPDPESLRAAVRTVLADRDLGAKMGAAARSYVGERFSLDRVAEMELELLDELDADFRTPQGVAGEGAPKPLSIAREANLPHEQV